jgi:ADP-heptose:LPS heptosyltransferase
MDFENGWPKYKWRWQQKTANVMPWHPPESKPKWTPDKSGRVLVWEEQGVGDVIMFSSIIPELYKRSNKLMVQVDDRLIPLFRRSFPKDLVFYSNLEKIPEDQYDTHVPVGSLPSYFRQSIVSFKQSSGSYLKVDENLSTKLRAELLGGKHKYICGISWRGGSKKDSAATNKSIKLAEIAQILDRENVTLVSLQYGETDTELQELNNKYGIRVASVSEIDNFKNIDGLASLIGACDHIVSIDNLTVHLAGALGKKTTVLLPFSCDWRWGQTQQDCYWHSSLTLFRQKNIADWSSPLKELKQHLIY